MKSYSLLSLGALTAASCVLLAGCASNSARDTPTAASLQTSGEPAQLPSYRMRNWSVVDDHTVVIEAYDGTRYKAETLGPCNGLSFATRLGFRNRGGFSQIDRFSSVVLPDGQRCALQSFSKVVSPETKALDSFEKLGEPVK